MTTATQERVDQEAEAGEQPDQSAAEAPGQGEKPAEDGPEVVQPADVDETPSVALELRGPAGVLALDPHQKALTNAQKSALVAIGIDVRTDPGVEPHIRPFIHMCQVRNLDPWAREAYLIGRGKGNNRKYTMQVGIDGYLKMAGSTRRYIGVKKMLWMGDEDDERSYRLVDGEMVPIWWAKWPSGKGNPGAAKAIVEYYDEMGVVREQEAIADWSMYAPYNDVWIDDPRGGTNQYGKPKQVKKINPETGKPEQELTAMWQKGAPHMLAKCALALALRRAFPATLNGFYMHEEMHQADAIERRRQEAEERAARAAYVESRRAQQAPANGGRQAAGSVEDVLATPSTPDAPHIIDGEVDETKPERGAGPEQLGDVMRAAMASNGSKKRRADEQPAAAAATDEEPAEQGEQDGEEPAPDVDGEVVAETVEPAAPVDVDALLREELAMQAEVLGTNVRTVAKRAMLTARKDVDAFDVDELRTLVVQTRPLVVRKLRETGETGQADAYEQVEADQVGSRNWLLGAA